MRRATPVRDDKAVLQFISIHALHEESDPHAPSVVRCHSLISIHALHEESDDTTLETHLNRIISIHALHEESDSCQRSTVL